MSIVLILLAIILAPIIVLIFCIAGFLTLVLLGIVISAIKEIIDNL